MTDYVLPRESYRNYMKRRDAEEDTINKQIGGDHYKDFAIMPIEYITKNKLDFCEGNIVKYISRHRLKGKAEDIEKVIHYAQLILKLEYGKDI
jgi:hypothetical protein